MKLNVEEQHTVDALDALTLACFSNSEQHGFWCSYDETRALLRAANAELAAKYILDTKLHKLALMLSELGEAVEGVRKPGFDSHCPVFSNEAIELADVLIRIMDYCGKFGVPIGHAVVAKMRYNATRSYMHGKGA
jgi:NTP pyrophosphatase (non-canonical NTP hydrolase)